jgi:ankyrin repeat protein
MPPPAPPPIPDQTNTDGRTALQIAEEYGQEEMATLLRELGLG